MKKKNTIKIRLPTAKGTIRFKDKKKSLKQIRKSKHKLRHEESQLFSFNEQYLDDVFRKIQRKGVALTLGQGD